MVTVTVIAIPCSLWAQQAQITLTSRELTARELFDIIENQTEHVFTVNTSIFNGDLKVNIDRPRVTVSEALDKLFEGSSQTYAIEGKYIIVPVNAPLKGNAISLITGNVLAVISNSSTRQGIEGAQISLVSTGHTAVSDGAGRFAFLDALPCG